MCGRTAADRAKIERAHDIIDEQIARAEKAQKERAELAGLARVLIRGDAARSASFDIVENYGAAADQLGFIQTQLLRAAVYNEDFEVIDALIGIDDASKALAADKAQRADRIVADTPDTVQ